MKQIVDKLNKIAKKIDESVEIPQTDLIIDSLDAITKAYGGTPNDSNLIVDKLEDIYNNISPAVSGNIEITENGENINVAPYATATVNVSGGMNLLKTESLGTISNSSGAAVDTTKTVVVNDINDYDVLLVLIVSAATEQGTHKASFTEVMLAGGTTKSSANNITRNMQYINGATGVITSSYNTSSLGVYPSTATLTSGNVTMSIYSKDSAITGTINAEYNAYIYGIRLIDLIRG